MKEIKTNIGEFFIEFDNREDFYCRLLDSEQNWIANVYNKETISELKKITHINQLPNLGICDNIMWASSKKELIELYMEYDYSYNEIECEFEDYIHFEEDYICRVGKMYFIADYTEI